MDKLDAMETFVAIAEEGSLSAAARRLGKAQSTVVRSLALLEENLGVRLIQRTTRRMQLTDLGRTYLERSRQTLGDVAETEALLAEQNVQLRGLIRVTAPVLFGQLRVAPLISSFLEEHPAVRVELVLLDRVVNLVDEGFDLGIRIAHLDDSSLVAAPLLQVRHTLVASEAFLCRYGRPSHPSQLVDYPQLGRFGTNLSRGWKFQAGGESLVVPVHPRLSVNHAGAGIVACEQGLCIGQFLSYQVEEALRAGRLVRLLEEFEPAATPVHAVVPQARLFSARQRALLDYLKLGLKG